MSFIRSPLAGEFLASKQTTGPVDCLREHGAGVKLRIVRMPAITFANLTPGAMRDISIGNPPPMTSAEPPVNQIGITAERYAEP